jgi:regulator of replication initiation timing
LRSNLENRDLEMQKIKGQMEEMKSNLNARIIELKGEKVLLEHKLSHYLKLEDEVDKMVENEPEKEGLLSGLPSSSARRTQQAVYLARQVNETKKELEGVHGKIKQMAKEKAELEIELDRVKELNRQYVILFFLINKSVILLISGKGIWK